ncbi:dynactin subunit 4-like [Ornithodoros turicata]|uniref:dynactin subunit 4-like n=1 Tax=Ornithodoros turicata TaxID=34597 RepID=UPI0031396517
MRPLEIFVLEHALKYQMGNAVKALRGRGHKQTVVHNLSSPYICLMYLIHVFSGYLTSTYKTISSWDPAVLKILLDVFQDMYAREKFTSEKFLVPLILRTRLLEIIIYAEKSLPPGFVLEKLDVYFPQPVETSYQDFAEKYSLKGKSVTWLQDTCKKSRQYIMNMVIKKKKMEGDSKDLEGFVETVKKLLDQVAVDLSKTIPSTGLERVDSQYCSNCLEYMPSAEARMKKSKCTSCFDCPSCMHTLSVRATSVQVPSTEDPNKNVPKKVYYLACGFCRWTSRDVGMPDQHVASGGWHEHESPWGKRINTLFEHYRMVAQKDKMEKDRKKSTSYRTSYLHFSDRYGVSAAVAKKFAGLTSTGTKEDTPKLSEDLAPAQPSAEVEGLPASIFTEPVNVAKFTTITQRHLQPDFQPVNASQLYPRHKQLQIKRSQRCRGCDHNLSKPEFNPSSIKFKIQLSAYHHIPELKIKSVTDFKDGEECFVELTVRNPTPHTTHVSFLPLEESLEELTCQAVLPESDFTLPPRDDTAEYDDSTESTQYKDDPNVVTFRKANKLGFYIRVIPVEEQDDIIVGFQLRHDFTNMVVQLQADHREPQVIWMTHVVIVNLGPKTYPSS